MTSITTSQNDIADRWRWAALTGLLVLIALRILSSTSPQLYFDVDPAFDSLPLAGFGPVGSLIIDALILILAGLAAIGEAKRGHGLDRTLILLAALPLPVLLWHGWGDISQLWRGMSWFSAIVGGVAIAHLARDRTMHLVALAVLLGLLAPLLARGLGQVTFEHADTIQTFEQQREAFFQSRGWDPDSSAAQIYERRLRQPQPHGWFATTNIYASIMLIAVVVGIGIALLSRRMPHAPGWIALGLVLLFSSGVMIWLSGSKGAMATMLLGAALVSMPLLFPALRRQLVPKLAWFLLALPVFALLGIVVRGVLLPEDFLGDRSLLFRWHYLIGAGRIFTESPLIGVGPDGFQEAYVQHRVPRSPEEVTSAHSVITDWFTMLGVLGATWVALLAVWLLRAARSAFRTSMSFDGEDIEAILRKTSRVTLAVVVFGLAPAVLVEFHTLSDLALYVRLAGFVGFIALTLGLMRWFTLIEGGALQWITAIGATVLLVHAQIEMTFTQTNALPWLIAFVGLAGGAATGRSQPRTQIAGALGCIALAAVLMIFWIRPLHEQQRMVIEAAHMLVVEEDAPSRDHRRAAAERLYAAYERDPRHRLPLLDAIHQMERAAMLAGDLNARLRDLQRAEAWATHGWNETGRSSFLGQRLTVRRRIADLTDDPDHWQRAIEDATRLTELDPHAIVVWHQLGDVLWDAGRRDTAVGAYRRALGADRNFELDPLKQLTTREREVIERLIEERESDNARNAAE
ncbi:MAG: hypothetical protein EA377_02150 [Phycisphaerales bacterium]|nr:MAG: hypothetical protein EA377_02150 [Phycisphaerales bacterium]